MLKLRSAIQFKWKFFHANKNMASNHEFQYNIIYLYKREETDLKDGVRMWLCLYMNNYIYIIGLRVCLWSKTHKNVNVGSLVQP